MRLSDHLYIIVNIQPHVNIARDFPGGPIVKTPHFQSKAPTFNLLSGSWWEELTSLKRPWCWERLKAGKEGDNRGWDCRTAPLTQWTGVWANSRRWSRTGKPGELQSMGSWRVRHDWVQWHPTPALLPRKSHGQRILAGYSPLGRKELDMTSLSLSVLL